MAYIETGAIEITVTLAGDLPTTAWSLDLQVCASGNVGITSNL